MILNTFIYIQVKSMLLYIFFQIIVASHAVLKSNADGSHIYFTWSPARLTSCKTIVKIRNPDSLTLFRFHQFCLQFCVCVQFYANVSYVQIHVTSITVKTQSCSIKRIPRTPLLQPQSPSVLLLPAPKAQQPLIQSLLL